MAHRAPPAREIAGDQRIICLLPNQEQWMSLGELRRSLRGGAVVPFPKDSELAQSMISCGAVGHSDYRGAWVFAALSHFLNSQGVVTQNFCKRQLRLSCCTLTAARELVEQFIAQVVVVREEVLIILQPGAEATSFPIWNDRIRVFVANQARMLPAGMDGDAGLGGGGAMGGGGGDDAAFRYGGGGVSGGASGGGPGLLAAAAAAADPHAPGARAVRQRVDAGPGWTGAAADAAGMPPWGAGGAGASAQQQPPPQQHAAGGFSGGSARSGGGGSAGALVGGGGRLVSSGGTHVRTASIMGGGEGGQGLDWSWPPIETDDRAMAEIAFDRQMGVPRGGWCVHLSCFALWRMFVPHVCLFAHARGSCALFPCATACGWGASWTSWKLWTACRKVRLALCVVPFCLCSRLQISATPHTRRHTRFLLRAPIPPSVCSSAVEAEAVWHLVMPSGTRTMYKEQFVHARYILKGLSEGRAMPPRFPEHVFAERTPLPAGLNTPSTTFGAHTLTHLHRKRIATHKITR
jgi:hypothetical protein